MADIAITILTAIFIAATSSWITVQLSLRQFRAEKWWEKRAEAYERVIEALHHSKAFSDSHLAAEEEGRGLSDDEIQALRARSKEGTAEIRRTMDIGSFVLSEKAMARLKRHLKDEQEASNTNDWITHLTRDWDSTHGCLTDLIQIAKEDLRGRS